jgi:hypothetical protein
MKRFGLWRNGQHVVEREFLDWENEKKLIDGGVVEMIHFE